MSQLYKLIAFVLLVFSSESILAQANPDPCDFPGVICQSGGANGVILSFSSDTMIYAAPGRAMPFWVGIGDTNTNAIDTSITYPFIFSKVSGPGEILGSLGGGIGSYYYYNDIQFTLPGDYVIDVLAGTPLGWTRRFVVRVLEEENFCLESPGGACSSVSGNEIFAVPQGSSVIPVDAVLPINVGVIDSLSGFLDSTFSGTIYAVLESGPGVMYGTLSMTGTRWFNFTNLRFSEEGLYTVKFYEESLTKHKEAFVDVEVINVENTNEIKLNNATVFPNPFKDELFINAIENLEGSLIQIISSSGQIVLENNVTQNGNQISVPTTQLSKGVYCLNIIGKGALNQSVFKVVK